MSAIKFHLSTSQDKDLDDDYPGRRAEMKENEEEGKLKDVFLTLFDTDDDQMSRVCTGCSPCPP